MNILIVGCGAMGSIYAALLASAGHRVSALDTNKAHVEAINLNGLRVTGASGDRCVRITASCEPADTQPDLVICAVKARFATAAAKSIAPMLRADTPVLTIQNGLGSAELIAEILGPERLIVGVAQGFGAQLTQPGCAHHNAMKAIRMGAFGSLESAKVNAVAKLWAEAGFDAEAVGDIVAMQWTKLICNVAYSAPCALSGLTVGEAMNHPHIGKISRAAAQEAFTVATALGITLPFSDAIEEVRDFASRMPDAKPSVLLDIEAGRVSEVDVINGAVPRQALKANLTAPVNATLTSLVQALEMQANATDS